MMGVIRNNLFKGLLCLCLSVLSCTPRDRYITITGYAQGGTYAVKLNLKGNDGVVRYGPQEIKDSIDRILSDIDNSLSGYNRNSLLSRFNAGERIVPDRLFMDIYSFSYDVYEETGGIVDVSSAPLFDLWGFGFTDGQLPSHEDVERVMAGCGMGRLKPDMASAIAQDGTIDADSLPVSPGVRPELNYNAIAQGYSCDVVADFLYSIGVKDMMVDIGEIFCDGLNPSGQAWTFGIDRPVDGNDERGALMQGIFRVPEGPHGVVTSGNYRKYYVRDGRKYAHTIDPRTGFPVTHSLLSATIVASDAATADAYATFCMVVGLEASQELLRSRPDLEGCLIYDEDGVFRSWCSENFVLEQL